MLTGDNGPSMYLNQLSVEIRPVTLNRLASLIALHTHHLGRAYLLLLSLA